MSGLDELDKFLTEDGEKQHKARQSIQAAMTVLDQECPLSAKAVQVGDLISKHMNLMTRALTNPPRLAANQRIFVNEVQALRREINMLVEN